MKVQILRVEDKALVPGEIEEKGKHRLPSFHDGWNFDFNKHSKRIPNSETYVLVTELEPDVIQGCLILKMEEDMDPYMAYLEIAPHNRGDHKRYDYIAGCLIAFACRLSHIHAKGHFRGYLSFMVSEEKEEETQKLMAHYSKKYHAKLIAGTNHMEIDPENGRTLIERYLRNK